MGVKEYQEEFFFNLEKLLPLFLWRELYVNFQENTTLFISIYGHFLTPQAYMNSCSEELSFQLLVSEGPSVFYFSGRP